MKKINNISNAKPLYLQINGAVFAMRVRYDYLQKGKLSERFDSLLGNDFLSAFGEFVSEHDMPLGVELEILWQGARVVGVLFSVDYLLILKIRETKATTPSLPLMVGETPFYPADKKIKLIPSKRK